MCGVVGISGKSDVNLRLYDALTMLQHRGQDAAGIVTESKGELHQCKGEGLARDVFRRSHMVRLVGEVGIGMFDIPPLAVLGRLWHNLSTLILPMVFLSLTMAI